MGKSKKKDHHFKQTRKSICTNHTIYIVHRDQRLSSYYTPASKSPTFEYNERKLSSQPWKWLIEAGPLSKRKTYNTLAATKYNTIHTHISASSFYTYLIGNGLHWVRCYIRSRAKTEYWTTFWSWALTQNTTSIIHLQFASEKLRMDWLGSVSNFSCSLSASCASIFPFPHIWCYHTTRAVFNK